MKFKARHIDPVIRNIVLVFFILLVFAAGGFSAQGNTTQISGDTAGAVPLPDIQANGSDDPLTIKSGDILSITVSLDSGNSTGENADWWVVAHTPFSPPGDWYHYDLELGWVPGIAVTHQGPLADLSPYEVLNVTGLPAGNYAFYFGVDTVMNGSLDMDRIYYDNADVVSLFKISQLVELVDSDRLLDVLEYLTSFPAPSYRQSWEAQEEILSVLGQYLREAGAAVRLHDYAFDGKIWHNLVATVPNGASLDPAEPHLVVGAHIDHPGPGADDNASGVSAILEAARVLSNAGFLPLRVDFVFFTNEEIGRLGSQSYAGDARASGENIEGMIAVDMVAYGPQGEDLDLATKPSMAWLVELFQEGVQTYTELDTVLVIDEYCG